MGALVAACSIETVLAPGGGLLPAVCAGPGLSFLGCRATICLGLGSPEPVVCPRFREVAGVFSYFRFAAAARTRSHRRSFAAAEHTIARVPVLCSSARQRPARPSHFSSCRRTDLANASARSISPDLFHNPPASAPSRPAAVAIPVAVSCPVVVAVAIRIDRVAPVVAARSSSAVIPARAVMRHASPPVRPASATVRSMARLALPASVLFRITTAAMLFPSLPTRAAMIAVACAGLVVPLSRCAISAPVCLSVRCSPRSGCLVSVILPALSLSFPV